ncbi:hypothetical protein EWM64_g5432 [Hericium alpestre]|uniref:Peptidase A1 domain-containing protein n=1 Tax=Hericium alpestre TaxID=135208 RepID=A0A4Y9ZYU8_9AGAM|nr:hypothetical protein EWM64_g5432 [Hericium alpestre]
MVQNQTFSDGSTGTYCVSAYPPIAYPPITLSSQFASTFDLLLGDSFLRNVYASFDYGEMDNSGNMVGDPFVQLLSTTDRDTVIGEFQKYRAETLKNFPPQVSMEELRQIFLDEGGDDDNENDDSVAAQGALAASDSASDTSTLVDRLNTYGPIVVGLLAGNWLVCVILLLIGLATCVRRGGRTRKEYATVPTGFREVADGHEHASTKYSD